MKIKKNLTMLTIFFALTYPQTITTFFNDDFEEDFFEKMHTIEKNIQNSFNQFHHKFFHDLKTHTQDIDDQVKKSIDSTSQSPQNSIQYYQQSTSSLSFSNNEKTIKITDQKNQDTTMYTINVTDKTPQKNSLEEFSNQDIDNIEELKALQTYIQKSFHSKQALAILEECMNAINQEQKQKLVNVTISTDGNQKKYVIEISEKKENSENDNDLAEDTDVAEDQESNKKKKHNRYTPKKKSSKKLS